ncbi:hypothetical protein DFH09DRAFT_1107161 [Mycena vulgaris]|nr:hypothetical protein DFH09DRAFT_1107161 [Mycena vulgaris]
MFSPLDITEQMKHNMLYRKRSEQEYAKRFLKKRENRKRSRKSAAQAQLNAILDPVARLPLEISSDIFLKCLPSRPAPGAHHIPMLFLNVCNSWMDIVVSTAQLWATIHAVLFMRTLAP